MAASRKGDLDCVCALLKAGADAAERNVYGATALMDASIMGHFECVRALLDAGADVANMHEEGATALTLAVQDGHIECVRALLTAGADVAQAYDSTPLMIAIDGGHLECARALLDAGANVMQRHNKGALRRASKSLSMVQLLCAYAPSRQVLYTRCKLAKRGVLPECAEWLAATDRWTSPLHHFEFLALERVRALLVDGADVRAGDGEADAPTPLSLAAARLLRDDGADDDRAALIVRAAAPWSPATHALFPAGAKARAVELWRIGWLLARRFQRLVAGTAEVEVALRDAWLGHVMPHAIERSSI